MIRLPNKVFGAPPPFSGGSILELSLNILELYNLPLQTRSTLTHHLIIQSWLFGYSDRTGEGDPDNPYNADLMSDFIPTMISKSHAASLRSKISESTTYPVPYYQDLVPLSTSAESHGTSHLSTVDEQVCVCVCVFGIRKKYSQRRRPCIFVRRTSSLKHISLNQTSGQCGVTHIYCQSCFWIKVHEPVHRPYHE